MEVRIYGGAGGERKGAAIRRGWCTVWFYTCQFIIGFIGSRDSSQLDSTLCVVSMGSTAADWRRRKMGYV